MVNSNEPILDARYSNKFKIDSISALELLKEKNLKPHQKKNRRK